jgi:hypothetical protein
MDSAPKPAFPLPQDVKDGLSAFERAPVLVRGSTALLLTLFVAWLDVATPPYLFLVGFYLFPIGLAIWYCGRLVVALVLGLSVTTSLHMTALNMPAGDPLWYSTLAYASVIAVFLSFALLMFGLKTSFGRLIDENQTDGLTGLRSRRSFIELAQFEISRATRTGDYVTLAIVDLDNFKHVNDTQGHATGDALLVAASRCMTSGLREIDIVPSP